MKKNIISENLVSLDGFSITEKPEELSFLAMLGVSFREKDLLLPQGYCSIYTGRWSVSHPPTNIKIYDHKKRLRIFISKKEFSIQNRFSFVDCGHKCDLSSEIIFTRVWDNQRVSGLNYSNTVAVSTLIYSDSATIVSRFMSEEQIQMVKQEEKEKLHKYMRLHWPEYENPIAYWTE